VAAVFASDPGEAVVEDAAIEVTVDDHFDIRTKKAILFGKTVVIDPLKFLEVIFNASIILGVLRFPGAVYGSNVRHNLSTSWLR
jgi:hypothetical protein